MSILIENKVTELLKEALQNAMTYDEYRKLMSSLVANEKSTGETHTEAMANYTMLNDKRMKRLDKTIKVNAEIAEQVITINRKLVFLVLTESWCGDAAQTMPAMNKIVALNGNISFKVILRDENLELMEQLKYNGTLSIPKLIVFDAETMEIMGDWGPRPSTPAKMVTDYKKQHGNLTPEFKQELQVWYNKDKARETVAEITGLLSLKDIRN